MIGFADDLHIAVFDAVVDHLHEVAGAVLAHPFAAGRAVRLGCDGLQYIADIGPRLGRTAGHEARAAQRALLAAGHAAAHIAQAERLHLRRAADGVAEIRVAAVDDDVALLQKRRELGKHLVHRAAGANEHHHAARRLKAVHQFLQRIRAHDVAALAPAFDKVAHLVRIAVEHRHAEAVIQHVDDQILTHDRKADHSDIRFFHDIPSYHCVLAHRDGGGRGSGAARQICAETPLIY